MKLFDPRWPTLASDVISGQTVGQKYNLLLRQLPIILWTTDTQLFITSCSGSGFGDSKSAPEQLVGLPLDRLFETSDHQQQIVQYHQASLIGEVIDFEDIIGGRFWKTHLEPNKDSNGIIVGVIGFSIDVSEQKRVEDALARERNLLRTLVDNLPVTIYAKDMQARKTLANPMDVRVCGCRCEEELLGKSDDELFPPDLAARFIADDRAVLDEGVTILNREEVVANLDGKQAWLNTSKLPLRDANGKIIGLVGIGYDITERKRTDEELKQAHENLKTWVGELEKRNREADLLRQMGDLLQVCNTLEEACAVIQQFCPLLFPSTSGALCTISNSRRTVEAMATWGEDISSERLFSPEECWTLRRGQMHLVTPDAPNLCCQHMHPSFSGSYVDVPMMASGEALGLLHIEGFEAKNFANGIQAIAQTTAEHLGLSLSNLKLRETLRAQSIRDPLTGLFNRRYMEESLERELRRAIRKQSCVGIIMLDIDHFKQFNDTHGHDAGDTVLKELGTLFKTNVRAEDIACRFGGEEFIMIMPDTSLTVARQRAEKFRELVKSMNIVHHHIPLGTITVSSGVVVFPDHSSSVEEILHLADKALYTAKHKGRDCIEVAPFVGKNTDYSIS